MGEWPEVMIFRLSDLKCQPGKLWVSRDLGRIVLVANDGSRVAYAIAARYLPLHAMIYRLMTDPTEHAKTLEAMRLDERVHGSL